MVGVPLVTFRCEREGGRLALDGDRTNAQGEFGFRVELPLTPRGTHCLDLTVTRTSGQVDTFPAIRVTFDHEGPIDTTRVRLAVQP